MVYCNYIKNDGKTVVYGFGAYPDDITGIVVFDIHDGSFWIVKEPEKDKVYIRNLYRLYGKYKNEFEKGRFREKISFES